jgi:hypothetical protein
VTPSCTMLRGAAPEPRKRLPSARRKREQREKARDKHRAAPACRSVAGVSLALVEGPGRVTSQNSGWRGPATARPASPESSPGMSPDGSV